MNLVMALKNYGDSIMQRAIYSDYTDNIELFGIDETWVDVCGIEKMFGNGL